ncbi:MBL fold metallo-hydrolase [Desulfitobacterium sp. AusDCA]|uniref:MBL fold metallo-hydrolase n=1 Tax=Desulfitobacterium sp. AusDCA TaxID=3240383 RepID=UPI003DA78E81
MDRIYNVRGGRGGDASLLVGVQKTALIDCGMAYCASDLIKNIKKVLGTRSLDYVFVSHSHYDHIGGIPYLKCEWPNLIVCGSEYDQRILRRSTALKTIRELSREASKIYAEGLFDDCNDDLLKIDAAVTDGDIYDLGNLTVQVVKTPGHTQGTLSFLVNQEILFASESTGTFNSSGLIIPTFIVSYSQSIESIKKCQALNPKFIYSPHYGLINPSETLNFWQKSLEAAERSRYFVLHYHDLGYSEEELLLEYEKVFRDEETRTEQPFNAFRINTRSMIRALLDRS